MRLSSHILTPVQRNVESSDISLSSRLDEWISRQHELLLVAQEHQLQTDQHRTTMMLRTILSTSMYCTFHPWVAVTSYLLDIKDRIKS